MACCKRLQAGFKFVAMEIICETERIVMRRFTMNDAPLILKLNSKPEVLKFIKEPVLTTITGAERVLSEIILPQYTLYGLGRWAMISRKKNEFLGWCGLKLRPELDDEVDLGYRLEPEHWGKGYATEAATESLRFGFIQKNLPEITGRAHRDNIASRTILQKIGLQYLMDELINDEPLKTYRLSLPAYREMIAGNGI